MLYLAKHIMGSALHRDIFLKQFLSVYVPGIFAGKDQ